MSALPILARDDRWVVVNKPPGIPVHRSSHDRGGRPVLQRLRDQLRATVYPVHRLDRPVSGCLLMALDSEMCGLLAAALAEGTKTYVALVRGEWRRPPRVEIDTPMKGEDDQLRDAFSVVELLGTQAEPRASLLRVQPHTGRYHQVRRHVRDLHHPIIGDVAHGDNAVNREWRDRSVHRLQLHCLALSLTLPDGTPLDVTAPLLPDHRRVWSAQPLWEDALRAEPRLASETPGGGASGIAGTARAEPDGGE